MTKKDMVDAIVGDYFHTDRPLLSKLQAEMIYESVCNVMAAELLGGGEITIQGVGKLKVKETSSRAGRNPRTGEALLIPAGKKVVFVPFKEFKDAMKSGDSGDDDDDD